MATKSASVSSVGAALRFVASTGSGHSVVFDDASGDSGARPTEVLLASLGACTGMDVVSILRKKRQPVTCYRVRVEGDQADAHPHVFTSIRVVHEFDGDGLDVAAVRRAIELSAGRYCAISATLASGVTEISHWYRVLGATSDDDVVGEIAVTGPHQEVVAAPRVASSV